MNRHAHQSTQPGRQKSQAVANNIPQKRSNAAPTFQFVDNRPEARQAAQLQAMMQNSPQAEGQAVQSRAMANNEPAQQQPPGDPGTSSGDGSEQAIQKKANPEPGRRENNTGLPDNLKSGIKHLSGYAMDDVKVHYNSDKPAQLQAHAYAQGTDIHVASGQEKHLPHEAWHVVQQKQGKVKPTMQMKGGVNVNDDADLEKEADVMGEKANSIQANDRDNSTLISMPTSNNTPIQRMIFTATGEVYQEPADDAWGDGEDQHVAPPVVEEAEEQQENNPPDDWEDLISSGEEQEEVPAGEEAQHEQQQEDDPAPEENAPAVTHNTANIDDFSDWVNTINAEIAQKIFDELNNTNGLSRDEAIAKSHVSLRLAELNPPAVGGNILGQIPKNQWWKLFIDKGAQNAHDTNQANALRFDNESSPGYHAAMIASFASHVATAAPGNRTMISDENYTEMHRQVARGTLKSEEQDFIPMPIAYSGNTTSFGIARSPDDAHEAQLNIPSITGFREMTAQGTAQIDPEMLHQFENVIGDSSLSKFKNKARQNTIETDGTTKNTLIKPIGDRFSAQTNYEAQEAPGRIQAILTRYYTQIAQVVANETPDQAQKRKLGIIVDAIRALHVGHFFQDANGRLNTMTLLNKFLIEENFKPVIMDSTAVFGGAFSVDQLIGQVVRGMRSFTAATEQGGDIQPAFQVHRTYNGPDNATFSFQEEQANPDNQGVRLYYTLAYTNLPPASRLIVGNYVKPYSFQEGDNTTGKLFFIEASAPERLERQLEAQLL